MGSVSQRYIDGGRTVESQGYFAQPHRAFEALKELVEISNTYRSFVKESQAS